jgi:hypothetical protein
MKRTRKWEYVKQEARRLATLGLASSDIAGRLGLNTSTVNRWFKAGKLGRQDRVDPVTLEGSPRLLKSPAAWAESVRDTFALSDTDDQLVALAEGALITAFDDGESSTARLSAMRTFQGIARQLVLVSKDAPPAPPPDADAPKKPARAVVAPTGDPRIGWVN